MRYINDFRDLIGNTPLLKLNNMGYPKHANVFAKLELLNPGGSVKDRMGIAMLADAEKSGRLKPGGTIIEATAGNAGIGIALAALNKGYRVIFTVPEKFSVEKQRIMSAYGAEIVHTPLALGMQGAMEKAAEMLAEIEGSVTLGQFANPANTQAHYETTGAVHHFHPWDSKRPFSIVGIKKTDLLAVQACQQRIMPAAVMQAHHSSTSLLQAGYNLAVLADENIVLDDVFTMNGELFHPAKLIQPIGQEHHCHCRCAVLPKFALAVVGVQAVQNDVLYHIGGISLRSKRKLIALISVAGPQSYSVVW